MLIAGPEPLRARHRGLSNTRLSATLAATRPTCTPVSATEATAYALRVLARRYLLLSEQITDLTGHLHRLLEDHAPALMAVFGAGTGPRTPGSARSSAMSARQSPPSARVIARSVRTFAGSWTANGLRHGANAADSSRPSPVAAIVSVRTTPPA